MSHTTVLGFARAVSLGIVLAALWLAGGFGFRGAHEALAPVIAGLLVVGLVLPRALLMRPATPLVMLAVDFLVLLWAGGWLHQAKAPEGAAHPSLPFLAAYLVTMLVAVTGRKIAAAAVGALAGVMVLLMGESLLLHLREAVRSLANSSAQEVRAADERDPAGSGGQRDLLLVLRVLLLGGAAFEAAALTGWLEADARRRRTAQAVDRELRTREVLAAEMAAFASTAGAASSLRQIGEAVLPHLRRHFPVEARAVFLDDGTERVALWEEGGLLDESLAERRRGTMQDALAQAGCTGLVPRLEARSSAPSAPALGDALRTLVAVPVHATGRVGGAVVVADTRRGALPEDRIGALAEVARQTGEAVRRLERSREEQTRRTSMLLGHMREGLLLVGPDGRVVLSNPAGREMLQRMSLPPEGPVSLGDLRPADVGQVPPGVVRRLSISACDPEGRRYRLNASAEGVVDGPARLGTLVTIADVTEEERARERLLQAEKLSVVGQTLAGVAHELNNPLAAIMGFADVLADAPVAPDVARLLGRIRDQAARSSRIVKNLLSVARRRGPERAPVSLNDVVGTVGDLFAYDARLSNVQIAVALDPRLPTVEADRHTLQQVLVNLVQNAIQALKAGGKGGHIEIRTEHDDDRVSLSVADDGPGVPTAARERIFEPFFTTKGEGGTGLGLPISRGIARDHGGDLVLAERGDGVVGAQFVLRLPRRAARPAEPAPAAAPPVPEGVPAHVLVVDDEAEVREAVTASLRRLGAEADAVASGDEALERLTAGSAYDAVLLDLRLPGASGIEVERRLRDTHPLLARRVVFMTGDLVNQPLLAAARATGRPVLEKPFGAQELRLALAGRRTPAPGGEPR